MAVDLDRLFVRATKDAVETTVLRNAIDAGLKEAVMDGSGATIASYDADVLEWSRQQAAALRGGDFSRLDLEHLADEIEDVGKSEQRELISRMGVLLAHLLKWRFQPERLELSGRSWSDTIDVQRRRIALALKKTPSLKATLRDAEWQEDAWLDAISLASRETGLSIRSFPETCPWTYEQVLATGWAPE